MTDTSATAAHLHTRSSGISEGHILDLNAAHGSARRLQPLHGQAVDRRCLAGINSGKDAFSGKDSFFLIAYNTKYKRRGYKSTYTLSP